MHLMGHELCLMLSQRLGDGGGKPNSTTTRRIHVSAGHANTEHAPTNISASKGVAHAVCPSPQIKHFENDPSPCRQQPSISSTQNAAPRNILSQHLFWPSHNPPIRHLPVPLQRTAPLRALMRQTPRSASKLRLHHEKPLQIPHRDG